MRPLFPAILAYLVMQSTCTAAYAQASPTAVRIVVDHRIAKLIGRRVTLRFTVRNATGRVAPRQRA